MNKITSKTGTSEWYAEMAKTIKEARFQVKYAGIQCDIQTLLPRKPYQFFVKNPMFFVPVMHTILPMVKKLKNKLNEL